ncbi:fungal specific transcription factor domain-containing protein [Candidatus Bathyarchaeota archaeon]|nr:fungal specific transcription factor domain-containing protein [Candidatus Bathyarchaeota archaeon]
MATQQYFDRATAPGDDGPRVAYDKLRLFYLVYVCDHHFSIAYGRSPLTRESELIRSAKDLLSAPEASEDDARLVSQVEVWSIATQGLELLGLDVDLRLPTALLPRIRRLMIALDTWRADWNEGFGRSLHVGNYPKKGVKLHFHFARLYLCSHAFRGVDPAAAKSPSQTGLAAASPQGSTHAHPSTSPPILVDSAPSPGQLSGDVEEIAAAAVDSAQSILRIITTDVEIQAHLNGLPLYFDTMIAFAIVFLYKVATKYSHVVRIDTAGTLNLVRDMARTLGSTTAGMHPQHLLVAISHAVDKISSQDQLLHNPGDRDRVDTLPTVDPTVDPTGPAYSALPGCEVPDLDPGWTPTDFDWTNYDFQSMGDSFTLPDFGLGF